MMQILVVEYHSCDPYSLRLSREQHQDHYFTSELSLGQFHFTKGPLEILNGPPDRRRDPESTTSQSSERLVSLLRYL